MQIVDPLSRDGKGASPSGESQDQPVAKIVPRGRDHLSKRLIDLPPVFLLGGTPRAAEIAEPVEAQPGRGGHARHCRIGWVAAPPVGRQFLSTLHGNWRSLVLGANRIQVDAGRSRPLPPDVP